LFHRIRIDGLFGLKDAGLGRSAALPRWLRRRRLEPENEGAEQVGIRTGGSEGNADAASAFDDAGSDLEQPQAQGRKLGACQSGGPGDRLLDAPHQPVCGSVQYQAHLIGIGRAARGAIAGELRLVALDQVLGLTTRAVERVIDVLGRSLASAR
jgi:hypothetical protein